MPNTRSDYPLTLAEVLFEELFDELETPDSERPPVVTKSWEEIKKGIKLIQKVSHYSPDQIEDLCRAEDLDVVVKQDSLALIWECKMALSEKLVPKIYALIHTIQPARSALCLSGGGIRSATFNLGVLEGLARNKRLGQFNYLSTVSGGGFIGSWLTAWIHRDEDEALKELGRPRPVNSKGEPTPLKPEPMPIYNLRVYSNYLTPRKGLLSVDSWTLIAVYLRNLLLNWLVFLPAIMTALMLPRIWAALVYDVEGTRRPLVYLTLGILGVVAGALSLFGILRNLPSVGNKNWQVRTIVAVAVVPLCLMAMLLCLYWLGIKQEPSLENLNLTSKFWEPFVADLGAVLHGYRPGWPTFVLIGARRKRASASVCSPCSW